VKRVLILLLVLISLTSCFEGKKKASKEKILKYTNDDPYDPKLTKAVIDENKIKANDNIEFEKILFMPYSYIAQQIGNHSAKIEANIKYSKVKPDEEVELETFDPDKNEGIGASDRALPSVKKNEIELKESIEISHEEGKNFQIKTKNSMGYGKEIIWLNKDLFVKSIDEKFVKRQSKNNEHIIYKEESVKLLKTFLNLTAFQIGTEYKGTKNYLGKTVMVFDFVKLEKPYKTFEDPKKRTLKQIADINSVKGSIFVDDVSKSPLFIEIETSFVFESTKAKNQKVKVDFYYKKESDNLNSKITIAEPKITEMINTVIPPDEKDAEEKILSFKEGHSQIDKQKKAEEDRKKLIEKKNKEKEEEQKKQQP